MRFVEVWGFVTVEVQGRDDVGLVVSAIPESSLEIVFDKVKFVSVGDKFWFSLSLVALNAMGCGGRFACGGRFVPDDVSPGSQTYF